MNFQELTAPPTREQISDLQKDLTQVIIPRVSHAANVRHMIEYTKEYGLPTIRFLTNRSGQARITLKKRPGGYLWTPPNQLDDPILKDKYHNIRDIAADMRTAVAKAALDHAPTRNTITHMTAHGHQKEVTNILTTTANTVTQKVLQYSMTPSGRREIRPRLINGAWNRILRNHFLNRQVTETAENLRIILTVRTHNLILRNIDLLTSSPEIEETRQIFRYLITKFKHTIPTAQIKDPEQLKTTLGQALQLPTEYLPYLPETMQAMDSSYNIPPQQAVYATCKALSEIKTPLDPPTVRHMVQLATYHHNFLQSGAQTWIKWLHILETHAQDPQTLRLHREREELTKETSNHQQSVPTPRTPPNETTPPPRRLDTVIQHIKTSARETVASALSSWTPYELIEQGENLVLNAVTAPDKGAAVTITKHVDGTISIHSPTDPNRKQLHLEAQHLNKLLTNNIAQKLLEHTVASFCPQVARALTYEDALQKLSVAARTTAKKIATDLLTTKDPKDLSHLVSTINNKVRTQLLDPKVLRTTTALFHPFEHHDPRYYRPTILHYNTVILNQKIFYAMLATGQSTPLRAHCLEFLKQADSPRVFNHPGEIISEIKGHLKLDSQQWRYFCRAAGDISTDQMLPWKLDRIALACQALVDANRPQANRELLHNAWIRHRDHETFRNARWQMGDPWKAWTGILNHYLAPSVHPKLQEELDYITDALRHHVQNQLPWGPGNWDTLNARSQRWHLEHFGRHPRRNHYTLPKQGQQAKWTSTLDRTTIGNLTFTPVITGPKLAFLGAQMGNCLATYWQSCENGTSRIFAVRTNGKLKAAVQIINDGATWTRGQAQAPHQTNLDWDILRATDKLAKAYQEAENPVRRPSQTAGAPVSAEGAPAQQPNQR